MTTGIFHSIINANDLRKLFANSKKVFFMKNKLTGYRKEILGIIKHADNPITVRKIYSLMNKKPDYSTVYRAVDFLVNNFNVKFISFCDNTKLYFAPDKNDAHFMHCVECHCTEKIDMCFIDRQNNDLLNKYGFKIKEHFLYFTGVCQSCRQN